MDRSAVTDSVRKIITEATVIEDSQSIDDNDLLKDAGLDSMGIVNMVMAIEEKYQISFPDEMLSWETLGTIASISDGIMVLSSADHEMLQQD